MAGQEHLSPNQRAWRRFRRNRFAMIGLAATIVVVLGVSFWPLISSPSFAEKIPFIHHPDVHSEAPFAGPSSTNFMGTDIHGRDLFSRIMSGARISLIVGAIGAIVSLIIGVTWGAIAGYVGGRMDSFMMRIVDTLLACIWVRF